MIKWPEAIVEKAARPTVAKVANDILDEELNRDTFADIGSCCCGLRLAIKDCETVVACKDCLVCCKDCGY